MTHSTVCMSHVPVRIRLAIAHAAMPPCHADGGRRGLLVEVEMDARCFHSTPPIADELNY